MTVLLASLPAFVLCLGLGGLCLQIGRDMGLWHRWPWRLATVAWLLAVSFWLAAAALNVWVALRR